MAFLALLLARVCGLWLQSRGYRRRHVLPTEMVAVLATLVIHWKQWTPVLPSDDKRACRRSPVAYRSGFGFHKSGRRSCVSRSACSRRHLAILP